MDSIFFSLSRELRDMIYSYVLVDESKIIDTKEWQKHMWMPCSGKTCVNTFYLPDYGFSSQLLRTSKMINAEATELLYSRNHFAFNDETDFNRFVGLIGVSNSKHIRNIVLDYPLFATLRLKDGADDIWNHFEDGPFLAIREHCGEVRRIKVNTYYEFRFIPDRRPEVLDRMHSRFQALASHKTKLEGPHSGTENLSVTLEMCEREHDYNEDFLEKLRSYGWILEFPVPKRVKESVGDDDTDSTD